jgi:DNA polymerase-3 subunit gamma/tau
VFGQDEVIKDLRRLVKKKRVPQALIFFGPSGTGKTTIARILRHKLGATDSDFSELNCADIRGIDTIRAIRRRTGVKAFGKCRVWLIDECHKLTNDAQNALLKILEDPPPRVYFFLCSTLPGRVIRTIKTRCTDFVLQPLSDKAIEAALKDVSKRAKIDQPKADVRDKIINHSDGSARQALVLWDKIYDLDNEDEQLEHIESTEGESEAFDLAKELLKKRPVWKTVTKLIANCKDHEESTRRIVLHACATAMTRYNSVQAYQVAEAFRDPFYDTGKAGLVLACWEATH